ncbi:MAG TPA: non-homologous end-joining DNA ligase [Actinomycetota bacterium]|nr:non-homologous end-joining DNA ligase [Actinomycetota bacterium]
MRVSNPDKVLFPQRGFTKRDVVRYFLAVGAAAVNGARDRPTVMRRFPDGIDGESFYQKRVPESRPDWLQTVTITFPSGRSADELVMADVAHLIWMANLASLELHPWPVRNTDVDHPDELRVDLDPTPKIPFASVRKVAFVVREVLEELGLRGFPKTSGKRGIHILCRIEPKWEFAEVRRAALAMAREVERRTNLATTEWWKENRRGVFVDYNQNARDRTVASAYSIRPVPDATVSMPITWDEVADVRPKSFRLDTVPALLADRGDALEGIDHQAGSLDSLLELADRDEREGLSDAPWPVHHPKMPGEPTRVAPSRAKRK